MSPLNRSPAKKLDPMPVAMPSADVAPGRVIVPRNDVAEATPGSPAPTRTAAIENALMKRFMRELLQISPALPQIAISCTSGVERTSRGPSAAAQQLPER